MKKNKLIAALGSAVTVSVLAAPMAHATENPFAIQKATSAIQVSEAEKGMEGKCSDGKCGVNKMKEGACSATTEKAKEGKCGEGKCGSGKMKEGGCSGAITPPVKVE
jgi:uncharacterized low-complexity protein